MYNTLNLYVLKQKNGGSMITERNLIIDFNTLVTLWGDVLKKYNNTGYYISLNNYFLAKDVYINLLNTFKENGELMELKRFREENKTLENYILFNKQVEEHLQLFIKSTDYFSKSFVVNPYLNTQITFYKGFNIKNNFNLSPWLEDILALAYWSKSESKDFSTITCSKVLNNFFIESNLNLDFKYVNLADLC